MKFLLLFTLFASILIISGCENPTDKGDPIAKLIVGTVKDDQGNLISDAKVFMIFNYGQPMPKLKSNQSHPEGLNNVVLDRFAYIFDNDGIRLFWYTLSETNNSGFEIQKLDEDSTWLTLGFVNGKGTTTDTNYYNYLDPYTANGIYYYRLKIIEFDGTFEYSDVLTVDLGIFPSESILYNCYPNPFDYSTSVYFSLRMASTVTFDLYSFKDELVLPSIYHRESNPGTYTFQGEFSDTLPSGGYKLVMQIDEPDSSYTFEQNILQTLFAFDSSVTDTKENAITQKGICRIKYEDIPFRVEYVYTAEFAPDPLGIIEISNNIKLIIYKPGYKLAQKDVVINPGEGQEIEFQLEAE